MIKRSGHCKAWKCSSSAACSSSSADDAWLSSDFIRAEYRHWRSFHARKTVLQVGDTLFTHRDRRKASRIKLLSSAAYLGIQNGYGWPVYLRDHCNTVSSTADGSQQSWSHTAEQASSKWNRIFSFKFFILKIVSQIGTWEESLGLTKWISSPQRNEYFWHSCLRSILKQLRTERNQMNLICKQ